MQNRKPSMLNGFIGSLLLPVFLFSQGSGVYGTIIDIETKEPIDQANIVLGDSLIGCTSDHNGFFALPQISSGEHTLTVMHIGYELYHKTLLVKPGENMRIDVGLKRHLIPMEQVQVIGSANPIDRAGSHHISAKQIRYLPSIGEPDLIRSIRNLPGITTTNDYNLGYYVRGGNRDQNQILLDGIPVFNPFHLLGIFSTFDSDAIQGAQIQKSNIETQYGNYLSSVLNIELRDGKANRRSIATNVSLLSAKLRIEGPQPWGSYMFTLRRTYLDLIVDLFRFINVFPAEIALPYNFVDGIGKIVFKTSPQSRIQITSYWGNDVYDIGELDIDNTKNRLTWGNRALGLTHDKQITPEYSIHSQISISHFYSKWLPTDTTSNIRINNRITNYLVKSYVNQNISQSGSIKLGIEIKPCNFHFNIKGLSYTPLSLNNVTTGEYSIFGTVDQLWFNRLQTNIGNRTTYFSYHDTLTWSPQINLGLSVIPAVRLNISWGKYHQGLMTIGNEEVILTMFEAWMPVPKNLGVMSSEQLSLGLDWMDGDKNILSVQTYRKIFARLAEYNTKKYSPEEPDFVSGTGASEGLELFYSRTTDRLSTSISYTYSITEKTVNGVTYPPRYDKTHDLNLVTQFRLSKKWRTGIHVAYQSGSPFTRIIGYYSQNLSGYVHGNTYSDEIPVYGSRNSYRFPYYFRLDANFIRSFRYKHSDWEFYLDIINLSGRLNVLRYNDNNDAEIQMPPIISLGVRTKL